jgi:hypothetical protein
MSCKNMRYNVTRKILGKSHEKIRGKISLDQILGKCHVKYEVKCHWVI